MEKEILLAITLIIIVVVIVIGMPLYFNSEHSGNLQSAPSTTIASSKISSIQAGSIAGQSPNNPNISASSTLSSSTTSTTATVATTSYTTIPILHTNTTIPASLTRFFESSNFSLVKLSNFISENLNTTPQVNVSYTGYEIIEQNRTNLTLTYEAYYTNFRLTFATSLNNLTITVLKENGTIYQCASNETTGNCAKLNTLPSSSIRNLLNPLSNFQGQGMNVNATLVDSSEIYYLGYNCTYFNVLGTINVTNLIYTEPTYRTYTFKNTECLSSDYYLPLYYSQTLSNATSFVVLNLTATSMGKPPSQSYITLPYKLINSTA